MFQLSHTEKGGQWDIALLDKGTQKDQNGLKMGVIREDIPYHLQVWECPPLLLVCKQLQTILFHGPLFLPCAINNNYGSNNPAVCCLQKYIMVPVSHKHLFIMIAMHSVKLVPDIISNWR